MPPGLHVRPAETSDAAGIAEVLNWAIRETETTFRSSLRSPEDVAAEVQSKRDADYPYLVGLVEGRIVACATYSQFRGSDGYRHTMEHTIVVLPEAQGKGLGRQLMTVMTDHARARQVHSLVAGISGVNSDGVTFHAALGFETVGRLPEVGRKNGAWLDLVVMQLRL